MAGFAVDGLVSGLDTTALINSLMQAEAIPQTMLKTKVSTTQSVISAYQSVNARFAALQTAAEAIAKPEAWSAATATSTHASVATTAAPGALTGFLSFRVDTLAAAHSVVFATSAAGLDELVTTSDSVSITRGTVTTDVPLSGKKLSEVVDSINASTAGVRAAAVKVGDGYRLQLTSTTTGDDSVFTVGGVTDLGAALSTSTGQDAKITIGFGSAGAYTATSATNSFADTLPGVTFAVSVKDVDATVNVAQDPNSLADKVKAFVDAANSAMSEIAKQTSYSAETQKGAPLLGDSAIRQLQSTTVSAVTRAVAVPGPPASSVSASIAGIQTDRNGKLTFDRAAFLAAQAADPAQTQLVVQAVADRVAGVAEGATSSTSGTLTTAIQGRTDLVKDLGTRITAWDQRLTLRRGALQRQFSAMEVALSGLKAQSTWLAGQIAAIPATYAG